MICKLCENLDDMEREYPDEPHHGACLICDECGAEYEEIYGGTIYAGNEKALANHPELKKI